MDLWTCLGAMWTSSKEKLLHITGHLREQVSVFGPQVCQVWSYLLKAEYLAWVRSNQRALAHSSSWIGCTPIPQGLGLPGCHTLLFLRQKQKEERHASMEDSCMAISRTSKVVLRPSFSAWLVSIILDRSLTASTPQ